MRYVQQRRRCVTFRAIRPAILGRARSADLKGRQSSARAALQTIHRLLPGAASFRASATGSKPETVRDMNGIGDQRPSALRHDLSGGLASAAVAIPLAMGYGMFAFSALGDSYFAFGALAGLFAAAAAGVVCVVLGDRTKMIYAPRVTTTFFLGALLHSLVGVQADGLRDGGLHVAILAFFAIILLAGALQALFGVLRLGSLLRFTPHPVMAGLQNAAAALLFLVQLGNVCGFDRAVPFTAITAHLGEVKPLSIFVAIGRK